MSYIEDSLVQGQVPSAGANSPNPVKMGAAYNVTPPSFANGELADSQCDVNGNLLVNVINGLTAGTPGTPSSAVVSVQLPTGGQLTPYTLVAPATTAAQQISANPGQVLFVSVGSILSTPTYLKFWDGSPTFGTTPAEWQIIIPGTTSGLGFSATIPQGMKFLNSIYCAVTNLIALTDHTNITGSSVLVTVGYSA